jgi:hypothetical protein
MKAGVAAMILREGEDLVVVHVVHLVVAREVGAVKDQPVVGTGLVVAGTASKNLKCRHN